MIIQSVHNEKIKHIIHLHKKKYRQQHFQFIAQGLKTCTTLQNAGYQLDSIYMIASEHEQHLQSFDQNITYVVTDAIINKISTQENPSGIVAIFKMPLVKKYASDNAIALMEIQDPGNFGTLVRTAAAMNIKTIYSIDCVDLYNPKVIQATTGTLAHVDVIPLSWQDFSDLCHNVIKCALIVEHGHSAEQIPLKECIIIIGNEGQGLPNFVTQACNYRMTIPMPGATESLNAAIAGSIAMYLKSQSK